MTHMYFSACAEGIRTFRHALRAACRTAISAAQILVVLTSTKEVTFRLSLCLSVNILLKNYGYIFKKFCGIVGHNPGTNQLNSE